MGGNAGYVSLQSLCVRVCNAVWPDDRLQAFKRVKTSDIPLICFISANPPRLMCNSPHQFATWHRGQPLFVSPFGANLIRMSHFKRILHYLRCLFYKCWSYKLSYITKILSWEVTDNDILNRTLSFFTDLDLWIMFLISWFVIWFKFLAVKMVKCECIICIMSKCMSVYVYCIMFFYTFSISLPMLLFLYMTAEAVVFFLVDHYCFSC